MSKHCSTIIPQNSPPNRRVRELSTTQETLQLELFPLPKALPKKRHKPQISSVPGAHPLERNRYRVMVGGEILGDRLTLDEALVIAKRGEG